MDFDPIWFMYITIPKENYYKKNYLELKYNIMSENETKEAQEDVKTVKLTKKGKPDQRSIKSTANVSKARSKVKAFLKAGKQILHTSDDENDSSGDEVIDLVIRPKTAKDTRHDDETTEEPKQVLRRVPLKQVLQRQENIERKG